MEIVTLLFSVVAAASLADTVNGVLARAIFAADTPVVSAVGRYRHHYRGFCF